MSQGAAHQGVAYPHRALGRRATAVLCALVSAAGFLGELAADAGAKVGSGRGGVKASKIGSFNNPVYVAVAPGSATLFVVEQPGRIMAVNKGKRRVFLDISGKVTFGGEQGLLSVAFAPDYQQSGLFYVYYVNGAGNIQIDEYRRATTTSADPASAREVIAIDHPGQPNHNGGQLQFGPDGYLYFGTGDGGGQGDPDDSAQDPNSLLGKLNRIIPRPSGTQAYGVPPDNPFAGGGGRPEVYSLGLRNPFRFSFDLFSSSEPRVIIGDVGQNRFEEVDYVTLAGARGANFGWNDFEGNSVFPGGKAPQPGSHVRPIKVYPLTEKTCSVIGGYVSRSKTTPSVRGRYVYGDFCAGELRSFVPKLGSAQKDRRLGVRVPMLSSFGEGTGGTLYATSLNGPVFKLVADKGKGKGKGGKRKKR